ncbi:hypothetical protein ABC347_05110 [Sphingomonas sp. 1P06PA]|uniref:hypothetical protein n=1 Tax=Sphingomonas sp. 1P06PA TaxID=554121 RepID=UPI0039A6078E
MRGLLIARLALVASMALFAVAVLLGKSSPDQPHIAWALGFVALAGLLFSGTACVAFRMISAVRNQVPHNG